MPQTNDQIVTLAQDSVDTVAANIEAVKTNSQNIFDIKTCATNMSTILTAPNNAVTAEAAKAECLHLKLLCDKAVSDAQANSNIGPATDTKIGLVRPGTHLSVNGDGVLSVSGVPSHASTHGIGGTDPITSLGPVSEKSQTVDASSGTLAIGLSAGLSVESTITAATTVSFTNVPTQGTIVVVLMLTNGGNFTVTWPASIVWAGAKAPALTASGKDMIVLATNDGGVSWWGNASFEYGV